MLDVYQIAEKISDINPTQLLQKLLGRRDIKKLMIDLNTDNQLRKRNENPFNVKLASIGGGYAPSYARKKGVAPNLSTAIPLSIRITLENTGIFRANLALGSAPFSSNA